MLLWSTHAYHAGTGTSRKNLLVNRVRLKRATPRHTPERGQELLATATTARHATTVPHSSPAHRSEPAARPFAAVDARACMFNFGGNFSRRTFQDSFRCHSVSLLAAEQQRDPNVLEFSDKIILPPSHCSWWRRWLSSVTTAPIGPPRPH